MTSLSGSVLRPESVDVAVIGGGAVGLSIAQALADGGATVCIIADDAPMASRAAAGMLAGSFEVEATALGGFLFRFSRAALAAWPGFAGDLSDMPGEALDFRNDGVLGVAVSDADARRLEDAAGSLATRGAPATYLSASEVRRLEPSLTEGVRGGLFVADEGEVDPRALIGRLAARLRSHPATRWATTHATAIDWAGKRLQVACADGALIACDRVVLATGAAAVLTPDIPVTPVKGEAFSLRVPAATSVQRVVRAGHVYLCPKTGDRLVIGATEARHSRDLTPSAEAIAALRAAAEKVAPGLAGAPEIERWAGVRPGAPDDLPIIGPAPGFAGRVFLALGHYRNGILWAPITAQMLARRLLGQPDHDLAAQAFAAFSPARFAR